VSDVTATMTGPGGITVNLLGPGGDAPWVIGAGGPLAGVVPKGAPGGTYTLTRITVYDAEGNYTDYTQGSAASSPSGSPQAVDLSAVAVTVVQPGTADEAAPTLGAFTMLSAQDRRPGEFVTWSFTAADASRIREVKVFVKRPNDTTASTLRGGGDLRSGKISLWIPPDETQLGTWTVTGVLLTDTSGNAHLYPLDGAPRPSQTFTLEAGEPRLDAIRVFDDRPDPVVVTKAPTAPVAIGSVLTLSGSVAFLDSPVPYPILALYRSSGGVQTFMRLVVGSGTGTFSTRIAVTGTARYQVRFLGSDLAIAPAPSLMGTSKLVRAGVKQTLTVATASVTVPAGRTGTLVVALSPKRAGATVVLQRWTGSTWKAVRSVLTRADGKASTSVPRPASTAKYRWVVAYDGIGLRATSATVTVRR